MSDIVFAYTLLFMLSAELLSRPFLASNIEFADSIMLYIMYIMLVMYIMTV